MKSTIAVMEGDGIGPEITKEAMGVLQAVGNKYGHKFELVYAPFGAKAYFEHGHPFPEDTKKVCDDAETIIKGPIGLAVNEMEKIPAKLRPEPAGLLPLRQRYDTFTNYRPVVLPASCADFSPLKPEIIGDGIDILMMRELVGGIYFGKKVEWTETDFDCAIDECNYTREQVERFAEVAFKEAQARDAKLTSVHKSNVLATSRFWVTVFKHVARNYPDVEVESVLVDNVAYQLLVNPRQFNGVMAMENMQGDILTDEGGGVLGSLGLMPSACIGPEKGYFEPAHGSAPSIAGKDIANPYSMIGSVALMLDKAFDLEEEAQDVWDGLTGVFGDGYRTSELANDDTPKDRILSTTEFGAKVKEHILDE
jgi:3-isopropylmalate dehydrogenase